MLVELATIKAEIERLKGKTAIGLNEYDMGHENGVCEACNHLLGFLNSLPEVSDTELCSHVWWEDRGWIMIPPTVTLEGIESLLKQIKKIKATQEGAHIMKHEKDNV